MRAETAQAAMGVVGVGALMLRRHAAAVRRKRPGRARWATRRDVSPLAIRSPVPGRLTLGTAGRQLIAAEPRHSLIVFGPTGSGKTLSVVEPALLEWPGPAIVTTVKAGVLDHTGSHRSTLGDVLLYDPTGSTGRPCSTWTPLWGCDTWTGASQIAGYLVQAAEEANDGPNKAHWMAMGRKLLAPVLFAAAGSSGSMADVVRWVDTRDPDNEVRKVLVTLGVPEALNAWTATKARTGDHASSVWATAEAILDVFTDPQVARSADVDDVPDITPDRVLDGTCTLFLVSPAHAQDRLKPLLEGLICSVLREVQNRAQAGRTINPGLLLLLDEAANSPLRDLPTIASTGREQGLQVVSCWQDAAQLEDHYGRQAATVASNHRGRLYLSGISDIATLDQVSRLLGDTDVARTSTTQQAGGGTSTSTQQQQQRLAPADQLRQLRIGEGVLVYGSVPPVRINLRRADRGEFGGASQRVSSVTKR